MTNARSRQIIGMSVLLLGLIPCRVASPQQPGDEEIRALRREIEALRQGQARIEGQLQQIMELLRTIASARPAEPREVVLDIEGVPQKGAESTRLTLIEFSDYQCPFCARFVRETLPRIEQEYIRTGKIRYVVRDFPLPTHPHAFQAALAAHCAGEQGKFWEMRARLFENQGTLSAEALSQMAEGLALDLEKFRGCLQEGKYAHVVRRDLEAGREAGVRGTPTFFLGVAEGSTVKVRRVLVGAQPYAVFRDAIESVLATTKP